MASDASNGGFRDEEKTVTVRIFSSHESAELAAANLRARGIECWVKADDCGGMYPNLSAASGVRLQVRASDADAATALLDTQASPAEIRQVETEAIASSPPESSPPGKLSRSQILLGVAAGIILCLFYQWVNNLGTNTYYSYTSDGKRDEEWIYRDGYLVKFLLDRNRDGIWDHWVYYDRGRVTRSEYDNDFDGKPDETVTYSNGAPISTEKDTDFNGIPDEFCTYKYGTLQQVDFRPNSVKSTTQRWLYHNGVLMEILRGGDTNGNFKEVVRYDPFLNPISTNIPATFLLLSPSSK